MPDGDSPDGSAAAELNGRVAPAAGSADPPERSAADGAESGAADGAGHPSAETPGAADTASGDARTEGPALLTAPATAAAVAAGPYRGSAPPGPDGAAPDVEFTIKGNADSMLFHTPDSPYYGRTKAEVWFRNAEDAEHAGAGDERRPRRAREYPGD